MNREIKFKAKCQKSNEWVFGDLINGVGSKSGNVYILPKKINLAYVKHCDPLDGVLVNPDTVSQFLGIFNSLEVWENDYVKCLYQNHTGGDIEFEGFVTLMQTEYCICKNEEYMPLHNEYNFEIFLDTLEVFGNKFDNSKIVEGVS